MFYSSAADVPVRTEAAEALIAFANSRGDLGLTSVFFCNSGNEANENALKIAAKLTQRLRFAAFEGGWHGRGTLPLSVTDDAKIAEPYRAFLAPCIALPWNDEACARLISISAKSPRSSWNQSKACREFAKHRRRFCRSCANDTAAAGTLLIFDEIQTGIGRLGAPFAAAKYELQPDLITSAKGIASGVPMGAVLMTEAIAAQLKPGDLGSTFGGSPLACAALLATLEVIEDEALMERALAAESENSRSAARHIVSRNSRRGFAPRLARSVRAAALEKTSRKTHAFWSVAVRDPEVVASDAAFECQRRSDRRARAMRSAISQ